jgi:hypothetical protein
MTGKYYSNSGAENATKSFMLLGKRPKTASSSKVYHANAESEVGWYPQRFNGSMMNYRKVSYDPIANTVIHQSHEVSPNKLKGLGEIFDRANVYRRPLDKKYEAALTLNAKAFYRRVGEFSRYNDNIKRRTNSTPFGRRV